MYTGIEFLVIRFPTFENSSSILFSIGALHCLYMRSDILNNPMTTDIQSGKGQRMHRDNGTRIPVLEKTETF